MRRSFGPLALVWGCLVPALALAASPLAIAVPADTLPALTLPAGTLPALTIDGEPRVVFHATGPGGLRIEGVAHQLTVTETGTDVTLTVPLEQVTTGVSLRDHHMRDKYLEVAKYPEASLTMHRGELTLPAAGADAETEGTTPAVFRVHGQEKPVSVHYRVKRRANRLEVTADFHVELSDHGIATPGYLGVTVKPGVDVTAVLALVEG